MQIKWLACIWHIVSSCSMLAFTIIITLFIYKSVMLQPCSEMYSLNVFTESPSPPSSFLQTASMVLAGRELIGIYSVTAMEFWACLHQQNQNLEFWSIHDVNTWVNTRRLILNQYMKINLLIQLFNSDNCHRWLQHCLCFHDHRVN